MDRIEDADAPVDIPQVNAPAAVRVGLLTVSDRVSRGEAEDLSGPGIQKILQSKGFSIPLYAVVPDEKKQIRRILERWADDDLCDCIVTTGGTGLAERDVTPDATARVLDRHLPALALHLALKSVKTVPTSVLSRGLAGARGKTLIVNLPGSPNGAQSGARILSAIIPHAVEVLQGRGDASHSALAPTDDDDADL